MWWDGIWMVITRQFGNLVWWFLFHVCVCVCKHVGILHPSQWILIEIITWMIIVLNLGGLFSNKPTGWKWAEYYFHVHVKNIYFIFYIYVYIITILYFIVLQNSVIFFRFYSIWQYITLYYTMLKLKYVFISYYNMLYSILLF